MVEIKLKNIDKVRIQMAKEGINLTELSRLINVSQSYLSQVLNGKRTPSAKLAKNIAHELGLNVNEVFHFNIADQIASQ